MAVKFGKEIKDQFFLDPAGIHLNHGSYGAIPKVVHNAKQKVLEQVEFHPDTFFRYTYYNNWLQNLAITCDFLGLPKENTVFVESATSGMNSVVKSVSLKAGDAILVHQWSHKGVCNACKATAQKMGAEVIVVKVQLPIFDKQDVVDAYAECLQTHKNIKIAVVDYIGSSPCVKFPVKQIAKVCHTHEVPCAVDGAHAPGQVKLDMEDLGVDFFVGNLHKWCYAARGCAVLWTKQRDLVQPHLTGHGFGKSLQENFFNQATRDGSPYLTAKDAIEFYRGLGGIGTVTSYTSTLLDEAVAHLTEIWKTERFPIPRDMEAPNLRLIKLPPTPIFPMEDEGLAVNDFGDYKALMETLLKEKNLMTLPVLIGNVPYVRISANVYNTLDDFKILGQAILEISRR